MPDTTTKERLTTKDAAEKVARPRLAVLALAQALGPAGGACRRADLERRASGPVRGGEPALPRAARRERPPVRAAGPGHLLRRPTQGVDKLYLRTVVDSYGSVGFGSLDLGRRPKAAAAALHHDALPFEADQRLAIGAVLTEIGWGAAAPVGDPCERYLALNDIEDGRIRAPAPPTRGFVARFYRTAPNAFVRQGVRATC